MHNAEPFKAPDDMPEYRLVLHERLKVVFPIPALAGENPALKTIGKIDIEENRRVLR